MFERICIPPLRDGRTRYDVGLLAECLLFYGEVVVQMHPASVEGLFRDCPPDVLFELESRGHLRVAYTDSLYATFVHTEPQSDAQFDPCFISKDGFELERVAEEVSKGSWLEKLPADIGRWLIFTGAGLAAESVGGAAAGGLTAACLGAIDTLLVDRLVQGWNPHQFVKGRLERFVKKDGSNR